MPSGCTLGVVPARYWIGLRGPVLPKYSYNVIRKCNMKIELMCLNCVVFDLLSFWSRGADNGFFLEFIGFCSVLRGALSVVETVRFK